MIGTLGGQELILILVIALIVFGPRKLPEIGKSVGKMLVEFRRASTDFKRTIENEVEAEKLRDTSRLDTSAKSAAARREPEQPAVEPADGGADVTEPLDSGADSAGPLADEEGDATPTESVPRASDDPELAAAAGTAAPDPEAAAETPTAPAGEPTR